MTSLQQAGQPKAVHEQWYIDFSYVKIDGAFYYFLGILDGYCRKMLNWRLCETMSGINAEILVAETKEQKLPGVSSKIVILPILDLSFLLRKNSN